MHFREFIEESGWFAGLLLKCCGLKYSHVVVQHLWGEVRLPVRQLLFGCVGVVAPSSGGGGTHGHGAGRAASARSACSGPGRETWEHSRGRVGGRWLVNGAVSSL